MSSVSRSVSRSVSLSVIGGQQNLTQLIKSLFADGTQGLYLNAQDALSVSDLSSIKDLSGRNNHATQANATSRASLITDPSGYKSLKFDGVDDSYVTQSIDFTGTDKVTVIAAVRKLSDAVTGVLTELSASADVTPNSFYLTAPSAGNSSFRFYSKAASTTTAVAVPTGVAQSPISCVATAKSAMVSGGDVTLKVNQQSYATKNTTAIGNYGNYPLYIGRRGGITYAFNGQIYALLVIGKLLDDATTQKIEKEFAKYIGVTL